MNRVGIVGLGHVGSLMQKLFPDAQTYDEPKNIGSKEAINDCEYIFICVPTPQSITGACVTYIVESVMEWVNKGSIIILRSTVPVGFTDYYENSGYQIVFQPEYYGETVNHPFEDPYNRNWITLGGHPSVTAKVAELYQSVFTSELNIHCVDDSRVAELAKYMENSFLATKVTFCNEFYEIAEKFGLNYEQVRETWLLDHRIGRSHTFVYPDNRGYGGSCLPKDISAINYQANKELHIDTPLLTGVINANKTYTSKTKEDIQ